MSIGQFIISGVCSDDIVVEVNQDGFSLIAKNPYHSRRFITWREWATFTRMLQTKAPDSTNPYSQNTASENKMEITPENDRDSARIWMADVKLDFERNRIAEVILKGSKGSYSNTSCLRALVEGNDHTELSKMRILDFTISFDGYTTSTNGSRAGEKIRLLHSLYEHYQKYGSRTEDE
jgi:hypothetical protein